MANILIADNSNILRAIAKSTFTQLGHTIVAEAKDGLEAYEMYQSLKPDIAILDVVMQNLSGIETLSKILEFDQNANIIMLSAVTQNNIIEKSMLHGAKDYLAKPLNAKLAQKAIENLTL